MGYFFMIFLLMLASKVKSDAAAGQLPEWKRTHITTIATNERGVPMASLTASTHLSSKYGTQLLLDPLFLDHLAHFDRQIIPERVVHAKGGGAFGYFETLFDITKYTNAKIFSKVGKKTDAAVRFSTSFGESGSADTKFSTRGIAVKLYTEDGNFDLTTLNILAFFIRDPMLFPSFISAFVRNPVTNLGDANQMWDFMSLRPEVTLGLIMVFGPDGIPDGFRFMNGAAQNTFKMVNKNNEQVFVKFHLRSNQGVKYLSPKQAKFLAGQDPDYAVRDLFNAIANKKYPSWTLSIQVMTQQQAESYRWDAFDPTKFWRFEEFPLIPVGRFVFNRNPSNFFADIEQIAFDPGNLVPGIEMGPDMILQGRSFSYSDTQRHRLGVNFNQLPVNYPTSKVNTYSRNGNMCFENGEGAPDYFPNSFHGPTQGVGVNSSSIFVQQGEATRRDSGDDDNFSFASWYWKEFISEQTRQFTVKQIAASLVFTQPDIRLRALNNFGQVDEDMRRDLERELLKLEAQNEY